MVTYFQLVELSSGNVADDFDTFDEAAVALDHAVQKYGADAMRTYSLLQVVDGAATLVAMEDELLKLVARNLSEASVREKQDLLVSTAPD